jgi:hypothetical protein
MEFKTRNKIWDKKEIIELQIKRLFAYVQNPIIATEDDMENLNSVVDKLYELIDEVDNDILNYLKSSENLEEVKFYEENYK